jgi:glycosyltransferase involved in cell wall biosynthesis
MTETPRIGLVGADMEKGLGVLTEEYSRHLPVTRTLLYESTIHGRLRYRRRDFPDPTYTSDLAGALDEWLRDLDAVVVLEYAWCQELFRLARERGIRSVLKVNFEFLPQVMPYPADLYLCSTSLNFDSVPYESKILLPDPVDADLIAFRQRKVATTFLHNAGTLGILGANCTEEVLRAIPLVRSPSVRFLIRCQVDLPLTIDDPRVTYLPPAERYWELYDEGDVFLLPQKFRATSLPTQEAMAAGMPVLTTDYPPFNRYCHFLVAPYAREEMSHEYLRRKVLSHRIRPEDLARTIDELAGRDISTASVEARNFAESISWKKIGPSLLDAILS